MKYNFCFFLFAILFQLTPLIAQQPTDKIQPGSINYAYLEHLTKLGIDSVRIDHGLTPLRNDSILYTAAKDHAHYLDSIKKLSHFENEFPNKYAPKDRVIFHGGTDFIEVGENVLFDFVFTPENGTHDPQGTPPHVNETYGEMAHSMVMSWVHSPPHFKNLLTPAYEFTGLAVDFDSEKNCFYAVQVFGALPYYKPAQNSTTFFPYEPDLQTYISNFDQISKQPHSEIHAWNLSAPKDSTNTCPYCWNENFSPASTKIEVVNGNIILTTKDIDLIKALIDNRKDGLAAEIVGYKPYDCANPQYYQKASRRNKQCIFSGRVLKPVYRKKLKRGFKHKHKHHLIERFKNATTNGRQAVDKKAKRKIWYDEFEFPFDAESYSISLGKFPKDLESQYYEINVVIIQKNQVCRVVHFTSFCGEDWSLSPEFEEPVLISPDTIKFQSKFKSYSFTIPFEQGKSDYKQKDIEPFLDSLSLTHFKILQATVSAFSSIEGTQELNKSLQDKRANSIINAMRTTKEDSFPSFISTSENWVLFDKQVKTIPACSRFKGKTHEEIKTLLLDTALTNQLEPWLSKERYAKITLELELFIFPDTSCEWISKKIMVWSDSLIKSKKFEYLDSLNRIQNYYFNLTLLKKMDSICLAKINWSTNSIFDTLAYNHSWLIRNQNKIDHSGKSDLKFYSVCVSRVNNNIDAPYWPCVYGMVNQYLDYWNGSKMIDNTDPETILKWIHWLKISAPDSFSIIADSLELKWYYKSVPYYESKGKKFEYKVNRSLFYIYQYWNTGRMNDSIALKLSNYLIFHNAVELGVMTLQPWAAKPNPNHQVLMQYIRLTYSHIEEDSNFNSYFVFVTWASTYLTHDEWCSMFVGPCNISFQLFDSEKMRNLYCEECSGWKNYAKDPNAWKSSKK